jgi:hypothetical protein
MSGIIAHVSHKDFKALKIHTSKGIKIWAYGDGETMDALCLWIESHRVLKQELTFSKLETVGDSSQLHKLHYEWVDIPLIQRVKGLFTPWQNGHRYSMVLHEVYIALRYGKREPFQFKVSEEIFLMANNLY